MGMKKREPTSGKSVPFRAETGDQFAAAWPDLQAFLADNAWEDGTPRATGSLTLFLDGGRPKGCLSDKEMDEVCFVSGATFWDVCANANKQLRDGGADWRPSKARKR